MSRSFASDNYAGIHPAALEAIRAANDAHARAYGDDQVTAEALRCFEKHFGQEAKVFFVTTGTAANVLGLKAVTKSYEAILCAPQSHLIMDECGAPEGVIGCKLISVPDRDGKIAPDAIAPF